eukprot:TRINITY_DN3755_c0_g1_i1.p1 TRINITY_DN3755_c0_g1~~TRINITY_DN3755_c0_g1_i1.p1  ORF type:complete len:327 (-),score=114.54 TRINITY_DN3755_c0_g1_i1:130-1110(-)
MSRSQILAFLCILAVAPLASAWWCTGHMVVAAVAKDNVSPTTWNKASALVASLASTFPESPEFISAACWADDLKSQGIRANEDWHYVNLPLVRNVLFSGLPPISNTSNVAWAINESEDILNSSRANAIDQGRFLRFLIHMIGDVHQPLHAATLYDQNEFPVPDGDRGGNRYYIHGANQSNLHSFFDSVGGLWSDDPSRPLSPDSLQDINNWAAKVSSQYPQSSFAKQLAEDDPYDWAIESLQLAYDVAYSIPEDSTVSDDYVNKVRTSCFSQVALGGYRLAGVLNDLYDPDSSSADYKYVHVPIRRHHHHHKKEQAKIRAMANSQH